MLPIDFRQNKTEVGIDEVASIRKETEEPIKPIEIAIGITAESIEDTIRLAKHAEDQLRKYEIPGYLVLMPGYL